MVLERQPPPRMNKTHIIQKIIETLQSELETYIRAAKFSHAEATAEENRAENKYDTRGLEASYLAAGQANKITEIEKAIEAFRALAGNNSPETAIGTGILVALRQEDFTNHYFIGPSAGGTEVDIDGTEVLVITLESPLGEQLAGKNAGDSLSLRLAGRKQSAEVLSIS